MNKLTSGTIQAEKNKIHKFISQERRGTRTQASYSRVYSPTGTFKTKKLGFGLVHTKIHET